MRSTLLAAILSLFYVTLPLRANLSTFTLNNPQPIQVENTVLPPGTYLFEQLDSPANHHLIQITNAKTHRPEAIILAINAYRGHVTSKVEVDFWETPSGSARAIRSWFSPGEHYGNEFSFPTKLVLLQPQTIRHQVLIQRSAAKITLSSGQDARVRSKAVPKTAPEQTRAQDVGPGSWAVISAPAAAKKPASPMSAKPATLADTLRHLPLTATLGSLIGLIGLGALAAYVLTHARRRKPEVSLPV